MSYDNLHEIHEQRMPVDGGAGYLRNGALVWVEVDGPESPDRGRRVLDQLENKLGVWFEWCGNWKRRTGSTSSRFVQRSTEQPSHKLTVISNSGQTASWLVTADEGENGVIYCWTHEEWNEKSDMPGAWTRKDEQWLYRGKPSHNGKPLTLVSFVKLPFVR